MVIFGVFTTAILVAATSITALLLRQSHNQLRAIVACGVFVLILARAAYLGTAKPLTVFVAVSLVEGFVLAWNGMLLAFLAPYTKRPDLYFPLAVFWLVQAYYCFGWTIKLREWEALNWMVSPVLGLLFFSVLAWRLGKEGHHGQLARRTG